MKNEVLTARSWLQRDPLYLDTETTDKSNAEVVQIGIIDDTGKVLINALVKPVYPISPGAISVHHIEPEMLVDAPEWGVVWPQVQEIVKDHLVVMYNKTFDTNTIAHSGNRRGLTTDLESVCQCVCAMNLYADYYAEWDVRYMTNRWQGLSKACRQQNIDTEGVVAHGASADCELTRRLLHKIAEGLSATVHPGMGILG